MKHVLRSFCLSLLFILTCVLTVGATDYVKQANTVSVSPMTAYTVRLGMDAKDFRSHFFNDKNWTVKPQVDELTPNIVNYTLERKTSRWVEVRSGKKTRETMKITFYRDNVKAFSNTFVTNEKKVADKIEETIYNNVAKKYGQADKSTSSMYQWDVSDYSTMTLTKSQKKNDVGVVFYTISLLRQSKAVTE